MTKTTVEPTPITAAKKTASKKLAEPINAPAGTYEYYCSVPGHREAGMVGTLTVE